ncbi:MAG: hypothetical protein IJX55_07170 [Clostridia bacterium]|nr:hypothetical protein [Clostridia bacterium]
MAEYIDIHSKGNGAPEGFEEISKKLSNFYPHAFTFDGVECASMEGFLQSLKYVCPKKQREVCALSGKTAKEAGGNKILWKLMHEAFWQGKRYKRLAPEYRALVLRAYRAMYAQNAEFREALVSSRGKKLCHSIGNPNPKKTILTEREFICCLYKVRGKAE